MSRVARIALYVLAFVLVAAAAAAQTVPDTSYGPGGTKETKTVTHPDGAVEKTTTWRDKSGTIREQESDITEKNGARATTYTEYDAKGDKEYEEAGKWDQYGYKDYWREEDYKSGVLAEGDIWEWDPDRRETIHKIWDAKQQKYVEVKKLRIDILKKIGAFKKESLLDTAFYVGAEVKFEDNGNYFATGGVDASYVRPIDPRLGLMIDGDWARGTQDNSELTKVQIMGGLALCEHVHNQVSLQPHLLGGLSHVMPQNQPDAQATNSFALAVGADLGVRLNRSSSVVIRADYNPTFAGGSVQNNFRLGGGFRYQF